ncbi:myb/SANT-like DNA-binding domain-containing protein 3 [Ixodes scapularis]|uniref:myb/SANT-like DNA-binding domain-containing protein 3 n=1 Tax=Ixodes scapularis TaxID=6945 RepID=UPI001A9DDBEF|nr:myb/SANT-like DNA-binding domain-containing protein 3 [Ixodes scapularis]
MEDPDGNDSEMADPEERAGARFIYTAEEKALLQALVTKHARVLENKKTNNYSKEAKLKAWEKLSTEYNSQPNVRLRSAKQLKKRWENEKSRYKKTKSDETRDIHATGGGPRTSRPMSPSLILVGAAADHMETVVTNLCDSDRARDRPVLSLPPAAMFEAMVRGTEGNDNHACWNDVPDAPDPSASPLRDSSVGAACVTPPARSITCPRAELPSGASRRTGNRIAALERIMAPEKEARVDILEREDRRKEAQHLMQMRILRNKLFEQRRRGRAEFQLLQLEREIKVEQLAALRCKLQGCGNHD